MNELLEALELGELVEDRHDIRTLCSNPTCRAKVTVEASTRKEWMTELTKASWVVDEEAEEPILCPRCAS